MKTVLFIVGSLRAKSFNRQLANLAASLIGERANVIWKDISNIPLLNQDTEFPAPEAVQELRNAVSKAEVLWIFTPEYNGSYPGILKNALDWLSRPLVAGDYATPTPIAGKKVAISGAGGRAATTNCRAKLTELLAFIRAKPITDPQTGVVLSPECWATDTLILSPEQHSALESQVTHLLSII